MFKKRILFLYQYPPGTAPSQRFRVEQYLPYLKEHQIEYDVNVLLDENTHKILYAKGKSHKKIWGVVRSFFNRLFFLQKVRTFDLVFIQKGAFPIGPPIFEWLIHKVLKVPIVFDFDDAIWMDGDAKQRLLNRLMKWPQKVAKICMWSNAIIVGNEYLAKYALKFNNNVTVIPTSVDTQKKYTLEKIHEPKRDRICIGWTGSHTTIHHLELVKPALKEVEKIIDFDFVVVSNKDPDLDLKNYTFIPWSKKNEIEKLRNLDIGLMPLYDNQWTRGKCGFKAIQYMALGIPVLASPVGVSTKIVTHEVEGLLCNTSQDWQDNILKLINNEGLRIDMGLMARNKIVSDYSVQKNFGLLLDALMAC